MASPDDGVHCAREDCHQLDFLPFTCAKCKKIFCLDHRDFVSHGCEANIDTNVMPQCPLCQKFLQLSVGQSPDVVVNSHISRGCQGGELRQKSSHKKCSFPRCTKEEALPIFCKLCRKHFCAQHRHAEDHRCAQYEQMQEAKERARVQEEQRKKSIKDNVKRLTNSALTDKSRLKRLQRKKPTDSRVQLMRAKMRSVGNKNVLQKERFYLEVEFDIGRKKKPLSMWFSKRHTIGRAMDDICSMSNVTNRNNIPGARRLFVSHKGSDVPLPTDVPLHLLEDQLPQGQTIVLCYEAEEAAPADESESGGADRDTKENAASGQPSDAENTAEFAQLSPSSSSGRAPLFACLTRGLRRRPRGASSRKKASESKKRKKKSDGSSSPGKKRKTSLWPGKKKSSPSSGKKSSSSSGTKKKADSHRASKSTKKKKRKRDERSEEEGDNAALKSKIDAYKKTRTKRKAKYFKSGHLHA